MSTARGLKVIKNNVNKNTEYKRDVFEDYIAEAKAKASACWGQ